MLRKFLTLTKSIVLRESFLAYWAMCLALPAPAALVIFEDGRHLKVASFEVVAERVSIAFLGGGTMTIPLDVVDRIIEDEVEPHAEAVEEAPPAVAEAPPVPARSLREEAANLHRGSAYDAFIRTEARRHHVDPALVAAVIQVESGYFAHARSRKGARGLMQLMPSTARRLGVKRAYDPADNIRGGTKYLAQLIERFGETKFELVVAAYNAGERSVENYGGVPPYRETQNYVKRVRAIWDSAHESGTRGATAVGAGG